MISNQLKERLIKQVPILTSLINSKECIWINPNLVDSETAIGEAELKISDIIDASERLKRFAPYLITAFPELKNSDGIIESEIMEIPRMQKFLQNSGKIDGKVLLKRDDELPISGSIKARGGIYEILKFAEDIAIKNNKLKITDDYSILARDDFKKLFSQYSVAVGSTGNLGLSIGIIGSRLGFQTTVHMSHDAKKWKKDLLRSIGVKVIEYENDYSYAVKQGREDAKSDPFCHFVDDENSRTLFLGYSVAALRLKKQFEKRHILVDKDHPLFVYLPCGVGGGPGGVAFGIKQVFGNYAHCFFAEPTHSPCMLLGLSTKCYDKVCVQDFGINNITIADGLAVGRASSFVGQTIEPFLSGSYTINDEHLYSLLASLVDIEGISLEPSAVAGMFGPTLICNTDEGKKYISDHKLSSTMNNAIHLVWSTGGNMVPSDVMKQDYLTGKGINENLAL